MFPNVLLYLFPELISKMIYVYLGGKGKVEVLMTFTSDLELRNGGHYLTQLHLQPLRFFFKIALPAAPHILIQHRFIRRPSDSYSIVLQLLPVRLLFNTASSAAP
jgi:hypothetical protein